MASQTKVGELFTQAQIEAAAEAGTAAMEAAAALEAQAAASTPAQGAGVDIGMLEEAAHKRKLEEEAAAIASAEEAKHQQAL